jgi:hypothetical protein
LPAGNALVWWNGANGWQGKSGAHIRIAITGENLCLVLEILTPGFSWSAWLQERMVPTGPGDNLPAMLQAIFSIPHYFARASHHNRHPLPGMMGYF